MSEALSLKHAELLARVDLFAGLDRVALAQLAGSVDPLRIEADSAVCTQGEPADALYVVSQGAFGVFVSSPDGRETRLGTLQAGDYFGEMGLLTDEPRSATVRADGDGEVLRLERARFLDLFPRQPAVPRTIISTLSQRLRGADAARLESEQFIASNLELALGRLDQQRRMRVLEASVLDTPTGECLNAVFGESGPQVARDLANVAGERGDFRGPLGLALRQRLEREVGAAPLRGFAQEAAARLAEAGYWEQSLSILARHAPRSAWVVALGRAIRAVPPLDRVQASRWIDRITDEEAAADVELAVARAALYEERGDGEGAASVLRRALGRALAAGDPAGAQRLSSEIARLAPTSGASGLSGLGYGVRAAFVTSGPPGLGALLAIAAAVALVVGGFVLGRPEPGWAFLLFLAAAIVLRVEDTLPDFAVGFGLVVLWILSGLAAPGTAVSGFASMEWLFVIAILGISVAIARSGLLLRVGLSLVRRMPPSLFWQAGSLLLTGVLLSPLLPQNKGRAALTGPLALAVAEASRLRDREPAAALLGLAAMIGSGPLMFMFLNGGSVCLLAWGLLPDESRARFDWVHWFLAAAPLGAFLAITSLGVLFLLLRPRGEGRRIRERLDVQLAVLGPPSLREMAMIVVLALTVAGWLLAPSLRVDVGVVALLGLLGAIATGNFEERSFRDLDWSFLVWYGVALSIAAVASSLGLDRVVGDGVTQITGTAPNPLFFVLAIAGVSLLVQLVLSKGQGVLVLCLALIPAALAVGIEPWVVVITVLATSSLWVLPKQTTSYLVAYSACDGRLYSHGQAQRVAFAYAGLTLLGLALSVPYWRLLGLL